MRAVTKRYFWCRYWYCSWDKITNKNDIFVAGSGTKYGDKIVKNELFGAGTVHCDEIINKSNLLGAGTGTVHGVKITKKNDKIMN